MKNSTSHLFWLVQTCSELFTPVPTCSHLFTPQWLSTLFAQWQFLVEFSPCESCYFSTMYAHRAISFFCTFKGSYWPVLRPILVKLHILTRLIELFPMVYGLWSCNEIKLSIPLGAHVKRLVKWNFSKFSCKNFKELYFFIFWPTLLKPQI